MVGLCGPVLFLLLCFPAAAPHPIHVSVSEVQIEDTRIEWTTRIYTDDLLLGLYGRRVTPGRIGDLEDIRRDLLKYLGRHIQVGKEKSLPHWTITELTSDLEAVSVTLSAQLHPGAESGLQIANSTLTEIYDDQKNIVHIHKDGRRQSLLFGKGDSAKTLKH